MSVVAFPIVARPVPKEKGAAPRLPTTDGTPERRMRVVAGLGMVAHVDTAASGRNARGGKGGGPQTALHPGAPGPYATRALADALGIEEGRDDGFDPFSTSPDIEEEIEAERFLARRPAPRVVSCNRDIAGTRSRAALGVVP